MKNLVLAVGVIFENDLGEILVLKRHPQDPEGTCWGLVGGSVDDEEDEGTAALREVEEEIGCVIHPERLKFIKTYHWQRPEHDLEFTVFHCFVAKKEDLVLQINPDEHTDALWAKPAELYQRLDLMIGLYPVLAEYYHLA